MDEWRALLRRAGDPVFRSGDHWRSGEEWWRPALALFCIADEAAADIGFDSDRPKSAQTNYIEYPIRTNVRAGSGSAKGPYSFSSADRDQVCMLPKSRTPQVGCTIRSLSHNLALLPTRSLARAYWMLPSDLGRETRRMGEPFNVVVLPMPFAIRASAFRARPAGPDWGWFDVDAHWCPPSKEDDEAPEGFERFAAFVEEVLRKAREDAGSVSALILPEVALSSQVFRLLCDRLRRFDDLELVISGLFDHFDVQSARICRGNFTGMARFVRSSSGSGDLNLSVREKHHRWKIDGSQIETYALGSALDLNRTSIGPASASAPTTSPGMWNAIIADLPFSSVLKRATQPSSISRT